ncbi:MAG: DNA topoisomerase I, partial [Candidatus Sumerlaeia bacterium]|nr:DNA topoisomerase I [Candidatus Sumerlaeia bacterium]
ARFSEAALVKKLEEEGIGRPSTYASIISTIQDRGYVFLNKSRQLIPTFVAMAAINLLRKHFHEYVDLKFTARMEEELDQIAEGKIEWIQHVRAFFRGTPDTPGLESLVDSKAKTIDFPDITLGEDPESGQRVDIRIGKYGPYLVRGENGNGTMANIPPETAPADLSLSKALELLNQKEDGPRNLGVDPDSGLEVYTMVGRFGAYVQLGETPEDKKAPKPRRSSLDPGQQPDTITLDEALELLSYPKELGVHPETGKPVIANKGRFGPYIGHEKDNRSLKKTDVLSEMTLERALELLAEPKRGRGGASSKSALKDLGKNDNDVEIKVMEGRYGPYVTDGKTNATLPKGTEPEGVTLEQAMELIAAKAKSGGGKKKAPTKAKPKAKAKAKAKKA